MNKIITIFLIALLAGCVSGPPNLTADQERRVGDIQVFRVGAMQERSFIFLKEVDAADCTGPHGRFYGREEASIDSLKRKAAALSADAIMDVDCRFAAFVNNCFAASVCSGKAVIWK
jgi:hypothetical protein